MERILSIEWQGMAIAGMIEVLHWMLNRSSDGLVTDEMTLVSRVGRREKSRIAIRVMISY